MLMPDGSIAFVKLVEFSFEISRNVFTFFKEHDRIPEFGLHGETIKERNLDVPELFLKVSEFAV